jgi:hypothetical protein
MGFLYLFSYRIKVKCYKGDCFMINIDTLKTEIFSTIEMLKKCKTLEDAINLERQGYDYDNISVETKEFGIINIHDLLYNRTEYNPNEEITFVSVWHTSSELGYTSYNFQTGESFVDICDLDFNEYYPMVEDFNVANIDKLEETLEEVYKEAERE